MTMVMESFANWLLLAMEEKGMTQSELARKGGVNQSSISLVLSEQRTPGKALCKGIAKGLGVPENEVLIRAGYMSSPPDYDPLLAQINDDLSKLPGAEQALVKNFVRMLLDKKRGEDVNENHHRRGVAGAESL